MANVLRIHERDPNFPHTILERIQAFLEDDDVFSSPETHEALITEMKLEAALITNNSPYAEVRAVVDNKDDPATPCSTVRAWTIGVLFSVFLAFINQLFSIRLPTILISANVAQLLAFPLGKAWERWVPAWEFRIMGQTHNVNPGRFNSIYTPGCPNNVYLIESLTTFQRRSTCSSPSWPIPRRACRIRSTSCGRRYCLSISTSNTLAALLISS